MATFGSRAYTVGVRLHEPVLHGSGVPAYLASRSGHRSSRAAQDKPAHGRGAGKTQPSQGQHRC